MSLKMGIDRVVENFRNFALFTNIGAVNSNFQSSVDIIKPKYVLAGEHGLYFEFDRGETFQPYEDYFSGISIFPIYPDVPNLPNEIDGIVVDIQDVGVRPFTFVYALFELIKVSKERNYRIIILDRLNPISRSFGSASSVNDILSPYGIPFLYPFTFGELGLYFGDIIGQKVEVIPFECESEDENLDMYFSSVSLNLTTIQSVYLYPALVLLEGLVGISVGRGTGKPFRVVGTKENYSLELIKYLRSLNLNGLLMRETVFKPLFDVLKDELLFGVEFFVSNIKELDVMKFGFYLFKFFVDKGFGFSLDENNMPFIERIYKGLLDNIKDLEKFYTEENESGLQFLNNVYNKYKIYARRCV